MKIWSYALLAALLTAWPAYSANAVTVTFDFDTGTPALFAGEGTPFDQTSAGVTAHFSSPSDSVGQGYSVQNDGTTFFKLSQFSGNYLYPNTVFKSFLDVKFSQQMTAITLTFATADFQQVEVPSPLQVKAYEDSTSNPPVGSASAQGTYGGDTMPMGTLSFNSAGKPFNLVELGLPSYPNGASDFLVDNIKVTLAGISTPTPTNTPTATPKSTGTATPTSKPTPTPTGKPTATPTRQPTATSTTKPTTTPTRPSTPTPTVSPTPTPTRTPRPTSTPTPIPGHPFIGSVPKVILVGGGFIINGLNFTPGSVVNFFVATSAGPINAGPFTPTSKTATQLIVNVPATTTLGQGFVDVQVVNTDKGFTVSNLAAALLQGSPGAGIPSITAINAVGLAATSSDPNFATNNVETVVPQGSVVKLGGTGFDATNGIAVDVFCACPGGKVGPFFLNPGNPGLSKTLISFTLPATGPMAPPTGPGSFVVTNKGADGKFSKKSNAVSAPIGQQIAVTSVTQVGSTITVNGQGFSTLTVINFFNAQGGGVVNLGGLKAGGVPKIPLTLVNQTRFTFTKQAGAMAGAAYVQALNPPFVPFTSSDNAPGGAFTLH